MVSAAGRQRGGGFFWIVGLWMARRDVEPHLVAYDAVTNDSQLQLCSCLRIAWEFNATYDAPPPNPKHRDGLERQQATVAGLRSWRVVSALACVTTPSVPVMKVGCAATGSRKRRRQLMSLEPSRALRVFRSISAQAAAQASGLNSA